MKAICKKNKYKIMHSYNGTMNLFPDVCWIGSTLPIRISESISMAHSADKKTILKNILKPFSKMFATNFMAIEAYMDVGNLVINYLMKEKSECLKLLSIQM